MFPFFQKNSFNLIARKCEKIEKLQNDLIIHVYQRKSNKMLVSLLSSRSEFDFITACTNCKRFCKRCLSSLCIQGHASWSSFTRALSAHTRSFQRHTFGIHTPGINYARVILEKIRFKHVQDRSASVDVLRHLRNARDDKQLLFHHTLYVW